jgi:hypothetical protein
MINDARERRMAFSVFHGMKKEGPIYAPFLNCALKQGPAVSDIGALCNLLAEQLKIHE